MASTKAQESSPSFEEKLTALNGFLDKHKFVLLTCRAPDGSLHARTMAIADKTKDMKVRFIYDRDSYKETEIDNE
jgi:general stress protein 26